MEYHSGGSLPLLGRPRYCPGANTNGGYLCETGHCCGETGCCTYYYELWWFWLLWTILILFSCCCAYRHRRAKLRVQQQQRQREISLLAYHGANSYPSSMLDLSFLASLKLPSYEEVAAQPSTPPPPYSSVFTAPRYPQPPRTADPHLHTQHDPLLHRTHSDGPSSLSSDNSSSCSCDSCCPSSPCSSSLSAPVTYETDTSHASTPSEAAPLTIDVTMETISAAATCLEAAETELATGATVAAVANAVGITDDAGVQEPVATESSVARHPVTMAVVTGAASPEPLPSPSSEMVLPVETMSPIMQQPDLALCTPIISACSPNTVPSPTIVNTTVPSTRITSIEGPTEGPKTTPAPGPCTLGSSTTTTQTLDLTMHSDIPSLTSTPTSVPSPEVGRASTQITGPTGPIFNPNPILAPNPAPNATLAPDPAPDTTLAPDPAPDTTLAPDPAPDATLAPDPAPDATLASDPAPDATLAPDPAPNAILAPDPAPNATLPRNPNLTLYPNPEVSPSPGLALVSPSHMLVLFPDPKVAAGLNSGLDAASVPAGSGPSMVLSLSPGSDLIGPLPSDTQPGSGSGSGPLSSPGSPALSLPALTSCPAITVEPESSLASHQSSPPAFPSSPPALTSSPPPLPSPPPLTNPPALPSSPPAPALLLDPLTALHQSDRASSGHASSLSPSPRATQSPPKQTLFSPCVDVFEPGPPSWGEDGEGQQEEDDDEEDMGADESQYRHRRLTGDSGIEVCRCQVEEEEEEQEEEEEEEEEDGERKEDSRRGGEVGGEREWDKRGSDVTNLHDSVDCPARGQVTTVVGRTLCNPAPTATPPPEDGGDVVIVVETV